MKTFKTLIHKYSNNFRLSVNYVSFSILVIFDESIISHSENIFCVFACPARDKCRICLQPGHFARDCKTVSPDPDPPYVPDDDDDENDTSLDDVSNDELASGCFIR